LKYSNTDHGASLPAKSSFIDEYEKLEFSFKLLFVITSTPIANPFNS